MKRSDALPSASRNLQVDELTEISAFRLTTPYSITPAIHPAPSRRIEIDSFAFGQVRRLDGLADVEPIF